MRKLLIFFSLTILFGGCKNNEPQKAINEEIIKNEPEVYLFSYFKGDGDGIHLAYSEDGIKWHVLNNDSVYLKPEIGEEKRMRDPCIIVGSDGFFHMTWSVGLKDQGIGYARSSDLKNWSKQKYITIMEKHPGTKNTWSPELFLDKVDGTYYLIWASTVPDEYPSIRGSDPYEGFNHRLFYATTRDFEGFSETKLFFDPGFVVKDASILQKGTKYYLFVKNDNRYPIEKNIRFVSNDKPIDFPIEMSQPITGKYWAEGASALNIGEYTYVYFDKYKEGKYGAVRSKNMIDWEDVSHLVTFPNGVRNGTAFTVSNDILENLKK